MILLVAVLSAGCAVAPRHPEGVFSFVTIGDNRSGEPIVQPQAYRDCIQQINKLRPRPDFVIIVGDLILGYEQDRELILQEWDEFDRVTAGIQPRVYLVPGNHDIWDEQSYAIYRDRYGVTYYSFDHGGSHFVTLCSEEIGEAGTITGAQLEWLAADLEQHGDAQHIFVFLHRPLWGKHRGMAESGWDTDVHPLLVKYGVEVVYAGHDHEFVNYGVRDGVQYYVTGGGGAGLSAGAFYHFMVTTAGPEDVSSVVVDSKGQVMPHDVVTAEMRAAYAQMSEALQLPAVALPDEGSRIALSTTVKNPFEGAIEVRYEWDTADTAWDVKPKAGTIRIPRGGEAAMEVEATFERDRVMPVPQLQCTVLLDGKEVTKVTTRLQPLVRRRATVARLAKSPVVDGAIAQGEYGAAEITGGFVDYRGLGYPEFDTNFLLAHDGKALYVAIVAQEPDPGSIKTAPRERDDLIWQDDEVELFIDATFDRSTYHQFCVNLDGVQYDAIGGPQHGQWGDLAWSAQWDSKITIGGDGYVMEVAIPYEALGVEPPKPGDRWGLNICRVRQTPTETWPEPMMAAWSIPYANFHVPTHFGEVTFE